MELKKTVFKILIAGLGLLLFFVVGAEGFIHHHKHDEAHDRDCAYCHWNYTGSQAVLAPLPPVLSPVFILLALPLLVEVLFFKTFVESPGRSPP